MEIIFLVIKSTFLRFCSFIQVGTTLLFSLPQTRHSFLLFYHKNKFISTVWLFYQREKTPRKRPRGLFDYLLIIRYVKR